MGWVKRIHAVSWEYLSEKLQWRDNIIIIIIIIIAIGLSPGGSSPTQVQTKIKIRKTTKNYKT
jgi:hypothetical protein